MSVGRFSVQNRVFVNILMVTLLILGGVSIVQLPREQFSEIPFFWANIVVTYPGVAAEDIEETITIKIEDAMDGLESLKRIQSETSEGLAVVRVEFDDGISKTEFDRLFQEAQTRFNNVDLPDGILSATVSDFSAADFLPVIEVILSGTVDYTTLNKQSKLLYDRLSGVKEVSNVEIVGASDRQVIVNVNRDKLTALSISIEQVVFAIRSRNVAIPGGILNTSTRDYLIRTEGKILDYLEFGSIIVRKNVGNSKGVVTLNDVATITENFDDGGVLARINKKRSISLKIAKVSGGNSTGVVSDIKKVVDDFQKRLPNGMEITLFGDSTLQINKSLDVLTSNAFYGFILLVIILFLFIGLRNALIVALGIPVTFAITFLVLDMMGETLNTNTLFALVLVLGLIVDHAIVIIENNYRLYQEGLSKIDAAIQGTNQVIVPVIAATLTTIAAFLPLMLLPGIIGKFLRVIPLVVSIALLASTMEAMIFLPAHFVEWSGGLKKRKRGVFFFFRDRFKIVIGHVFRFRYLFILAVIVVMGWSLSLVSSIKQDLFSAEDFSLFYIDIEMPPGTPRDKTDQVVQRFEDQLIPLIGKGEITAINSSIGFSSGGNANQRSANIAQIIVDLIEKDEGRERSILEIIQDVKRQCAIIPGMDRVQYRKAQNGPPISPPVSYRLFGNNYDHLIAVSDAIQTKLRGYPELYNIEDNLDPGTPEIKILVDPTRAALYGLSTQDVGRYIRTSFDGVTATTIFSQNEEVEVIVKFSQLQQNSILDIQQIQIPTQSGTSIPFSSIAEVAEDTPFGSIKRVDGKREITITSEAYNEENVRTINRTIKAYFNGEFQARYPEIELSVGGEFADFNDLLVQILRIFLIGLFLIYAILGTQFNSYTQPVLILFSIPFAFVGVIFYLALSGTPFSTTVLYAGVALAGIAVNDSIVLISFINNLIKADASVFEAVTEAASTRLRPIILTSLTTIAGLLPTALGIGGESVVWGPMASTIIFGLIFSTITVLFLIPCLYGVLVDVKVGLKKLVPGKRKNRSKCLPVS